MRDAPLRCRVRKALPGRPPNLLLLVHGYSYHPEEMLAYGTVVDPDRRFVVVAPRGPIDLPNGAAAWALPKNRVPPQFAEAAALLDATLDAACERYEVPRERALVGGFSQGAILAFTLALDPGRVRPAGVVNWCGGLPVNRGTTVDLDRLAGLPVLWQTASRDEVIPRVHAQEQRATVAAHGAVLEAHEYDSTHAVSVELLADARTWLAAR